MYFLNRAPYAAASGAASMSAVAVPEAAVEVEIETTDDRTTIDKAAPVDQVTAETATMDDAVVGTAVDQTGVGTGIVVEAAPVEDNAVEIEATCDTDEVVLAAVVNNTAGISFSSILKMDETPYRRSETKDGKSRRKVAYAAVLTSSLYKNELEAFRAKQLAKTAGAAGKRGIHV